VQAYLLAFCFTQAVEMPIYVAALDCGWLAAFGASLLTHPIVWFVIFDPSWHMSYALASVIAELFAWLVEAAYFGWWLRLRRALGVTFVANLASCVIGLVSRRLFGVP
jgi:hypothetical protein